MRSHRYSGILLLLISMFFLMGVHASYSAGKQTVFRSAYVKPVNPHPKVASSLRQAMDFLKTSTKAEKKAYFKRFSPHNPPPFRFDDQNRIQCYVQCYNLEPETLEKLKKYGVAIQCTDPQRKIVQTWISSDQVQILETLPEVKFIRPPSYPVKEVGSVTTEAYKALHIDSFVNRPEFIGSNVTGQGIKVGAISSAINRADLSSRYGDLPTTTTGISNMFGGITYWSFRTNPMTGLPYGDDVTGIINYWMGIPDEEGTAMLEIIHDIVPDARLYFSNFDTDIEMNMSKDWLRQQGCDVIVDDISFYNTGPYDGESVVSLGSTRQVEHGVAYYTSVGNGAEEHWWGYFQDPEVNNISNFAPLDETLEVRIPSGYTVYAHLSWDEPWGESGYDIDMYMLDPNFLDFGNPYSYSTDLQLGDGDPAEGCGVFNNTFEPAVISIVIARKEKEEPYDDSKPMRMNLHLMGGEITEKDYMISAGSIGNNSDAKKAISVGAIDVSSRLHNVVEYFSSRGPTWDGRLKPEIACFDGTSSGRALWGTYFNPFFGTSAAAPHAAAVAAMIKGYKVDAGDSDFTNPWDPERVVDNINAAIFQGAEDMKPDGVDYMSGYGRINANNIFLNLLDPAQRRKVYDFSKDMQDWLYVGVPGYFTEPIHYYESGRLVLKSRDDNTFGYWESPVIQFPDAMEPDSQASTNFNPAKIYVIRFRVATTSVPDKFPSFRLRANGMKETINHTRTFNSNPGQEHYPGELGTDYYLCFRPTNTEMMNGIRVAFDILSFTAEDDLDGVLYLDEVEITEHPAP